jgi:chromosome segregation ATPase
VAFRLFSKFTSSYIAPGVAPGMPSKPAIQSPRIRPESPALATELDTLSVFFPEDNSSIAAQARRRVTDNLHAASRYTSDADDQENSAASRIDAKRLDDFRKLFRQTQEAVEQMKVEANAIRDDLRELRTLGDHLSQGYTRLGDICRLTEKRSELTVDVLDGIEKRIEPLEVVRELSATTEENFASLKQLAEEVMQRGTRFEAQKDAIDRAHEETMRVARLMEELQARVAVLTEKGEWLGEAEATVGRLEHRAVETTAHLDQRATETMAALERRIDGFDGRKRAIEWALAAACTQSDETLKQAEATVGWLEQQAAETTAQLERRVDHFDTQKHTIEQALTTALTDGDQRLAHAQETVRRLEHQSAETASQLERRVSHFDEKRQTIEQALVAAVTGSDKELRRAEATAGRLQQRAAASMDQLERRIDNFDAQKSTIERATAEAMRVTAVLNAVEARAAALTGSDHALGQAEKAVGHLEQRTAEARVRVEQVVRSKNDIEDELERVHEQLQSLTESARSSVIIFRSADPRQTVAWKVRIRRPLLRWAAVFAVLVAVNALGIAMVVGPDQPGRIASATLADVQEPSAPLSPLPSTASDFAMFDMPAGRASATTGTMVATKAPSVEPRVERRDRPRPAPVAPATVVAQAIASKQPVPYVGALTVDSDPAGSAVFVDREFVGETPLELTKLRVGSHVVRIERDGHDRWTTAVLVAADKHTRVSARLQATQDR